MNVKETPADCVCLVRARSRVVVMPADTGMSVEVLRCFGWSAAPETQRGGTRMRSARDWRSCLAASFPPTLGVGRESCGSRLTCARAFPGTIPITSVCEPFAVGLMISSPYSVFIDLTPCRFLDGVTINMTLKYLITECLAEILWKWVCSIHIYGLVVYRGSSPIDTTTYTLQRLG